MSTAYVERSTAIIGRTEGLELVPHAARSLAEGEPVAIERLAAAAGRSVEDIETTLGELDVAPAATASRATVSSRSHRPAVGWWGTVARAMVGSVLVVLATVVWRAGWLELLIGLVALPAVATLAMSLRDRSARPLRLGAAGHVVTLAHVAVTVSIVPEAAALFYGSMALVAGLQGNGGCEITALANWLRERDDRIGCPLFAPFDALDRRRRGA
jgi:Helix-turn-helix domain of alkylmercury lyase